MAGARKDLKRSRDEESEGNKTRRVTPENDIQGSYTSMPMNPAPSPAPSQTPSLPPGASTSTPKPVPPPVWTKTITIPRPSAPPSNSSQGGILRLLGSAAAPSLLEDEGEDKGHLSRGEKYDLLQIEETDYNTPKTTDSVKESQLLKTKTVNHPSTTCVVKELFGILPSSRPPPGETESEEEYEDEGEELTMTVKDRGEVDAHEQQIEADGLDISLEEDMVEDSVKFNALKVKFNKQSKIVQRSVALIKNQQKTIDNMQINKADVTNKAISNCMKAYNGPRFAALDLRLSELKNLLSQTKTEATNANARAGTLVSAMENKRSKKSLLKKNSEHLVQRQIFRNPPPNLLQQPRLQQQQPHLQQQSHPQQLPHFQQQPYQNFNHQHFNQQTSFPQQNNIQMPQQNNVNIPQQSQFTAPPLNYNFQQALNYNLQQARQQGQGQ